MGCHPKENLGGQVRPLQITLTDVIKFYAVIHYSEMTVVLWKGFNFPAFQGNVLLQQVDT